MPSAFAPPRHVDVEAVEVAEVADSGAEDGAGAEVNVEEPWANYTAMRAPEIVDRLVAEPDAVLALLLLHERRNRARRTVLAAAERELGKRRRTA